MAAETILVVDDDPDIARFVEVNLRSAGYDVAVAGDGEEALEKAGELRPDLVLLDVMMPRIDGFEVAQRLRKNPQTANTSIIMLTAKALSADKVTGLQSGADDYIIKPFDPIELLARVKGTLRRAKEMRNLSPLTGLPGNIRIQEEIERQVREARPFAVLYCDLDNFKTYNDQKGFVRGDRMIQATARIIQDAVVEFDGAEGFVGHVGGDDFVAVVSPEVAEGSREKDLRYVRSCPFGVLRTRRHLPGLRAHGGPQGCTSGHSACRRLGGDRVQLQAGVRPLRRGRGRRHRDEAVRQARGLFVRGRPPNSGLTPFLSRARRRRGAVRILFPRRARLQGGVQIPTGGESPRPLASQPRVDPV